MARTLERRVWWLNRTRQVTALVRVAGSEAVQIAAAATLRPGTDWVVPHQRDLALCLALGLSPLDVMLAVFGRAGDPTSGGRMAPPSFGSRGARIAGTSHSAGSSVVHAAGIAYASKLQGLDEVTLVSVGLPAADAGDWHEGINFATVHRLPLVCLVQDVAPQDAVPLEQPGADLLVRSAVGYGAAGEVIDAADFNDAFVTLSRAVERARSGAGPTILHARVSDMGAATRSGPGRPREQMEALAAEDPIDLMRRDLQGMQLIDERVNDQIKRDCLAVVEEAVLQARASAPPKPAAALDNVFEETADA